MKNPANKGAEFERAQAKLLSLWASEGKSKDLLWRTGMSGGRHTIGALKNHGYGDLQVLKPTPEALKFMSTFCVELKHYKTFDLTSEWLNDKSNLKIWWAKLKREASDNKVQPLLIVKPNLKPAMMFFDKNYINRCLRPFSLSLLSRVELIFGAEHLVGFVQNQFLSDILFIDLKEIQRRPR